MRTLAAPILADRVVPHPAAHAAREGARVGLVLGGCVALWVAARAVLGGGGSADVLPIETAVRWAAETASLGTPGAPWRAMAAPLAVMMALHLAAAAAVGAAAAMIAVVPALARAALVLALVAAEYAVWRVAGGHAAGPWLRATIWYHLATSTLTVIALLERTTVSRDHRPALTEAHDDRHARRARVRGAPSPRRSPERGVPA
jgi:hypothetical protein